MGFYVPFVFPWASLTHLLALGFLSPFTNFVFPWAFTGFIGFWAYCGPFLLFSHHTLPMGLLFTISLFPSSFEPIRFLKAHLHILWTVIHYSCCSDLMVFVLYLLPTYFRSMLLGWASSLLFGFHKKTLNEGL